MKKVTDGEKFTLWNAQSFDGTPTSITLPELPEGFQWDTSELLKPTGIIKAVAVVSGISALPADGTFEGAVYNLGGVKIADITTTKATVENDIRNIAGPGAYILRSGKTMVKIVIR